MNRTRLIFFGALAVVLLILAGSLAENIVNEGTLLQIFVTTTVFGVGVVLLDFTGLLGHHAGDTAGDTAGDLGGHAGAEIAGHDFGGHDLGGHDLGGHAGAHADAGDGQAGGAHDAAAAAGHIGHGEHAGQHENGNRANGSQSAAPILSVLAYLRLLVYFCLGFGPAGWIGLAGGLGALGSLALATPVGLGALFLARAFFRLQRKDTGAVPPEADLVGEHATVVVPLDSRTMGKVRVQAGLEVTDLYAIAADEGAQFEHGADVRIVQVTDECVRVR